MLFSLIVPTKGRVGEVERLLQSLAAQTLQDFEIILSDQNEDDRLAGLVEESKWSGQLIHVKSSGGASRARNAGLALAKGELVAFPDDDCCFPPQLLERVARFFEAHPEYGFLGGSSFSDEGGDAVSRHAREAAPVEHRTVYSQCIEFAFFIRRSQLGDLRFDEEMGVGSPTPWQSDEGPDLMLRLKGQGIEGYYDPQYAVWHPRPVIDYDDKAIDRSFRYACGNGYFLRKHGYTLSHIVYLTARTACGFGVACLSLNWGKARFYWARIRGRWVGWKGYEQVSK